MEENKDKKIAYESLTSKQSLEALQSDEKVGLTSEEAKKRYEKYGPNKLEEKKKKNWFQIFLEQLKDPMIYVLLAAIAVTIGISIYETIHAVNSGENVSNWFLDVGDWPDVIIIMGVLVINGIIGTVQEIKAQTSLEALRQLSSPESKVIRDGKIVKIKSSELVIGDVVILEEGDTIGADIRLIEAINFKANESSLTGESVPVEKDANLTFSKEVGIADRKNIAYMSTPVTYGRGKGVVINTGMNTEIGKIAKALDNEEDSETPLQKVLAKLSKTLGILTVCIVVAVLAVDIIWLLIGGKANNPDSWVEAFLSSIALAVAAIPEGLPAVVTIVLSIGVQRMVKANTVVRKLPSVETLGAVKVVCSDKTGTLTQNKMTVTEAFVDFKYYTEDSFTSSNKDEDLRLLAKGMSLCSNAEVDNGEFGDPTEIALVVLANKFDMHKNDLEVVHKRVDELPFDSVRKMMTTKHVFNENTTISFTKGALDSIIVRCTHILENGKVRELTQKDIDTIYEANKYFSSKALRVLALAYNNKEKIDEFDLVFVGLTAMIDPARPEAKPAVQMFKDAGITTVMITGDHKDTAFAIAKELGIVDSIDNCMMGSEVDKLSFDELKEACKRVRVFARVSPENKVQIVKAFESNGNICAMTGDGVNDAPSLKAADIGIAMGITGTDVAKGAADMVLTDDNFASIEKAVEEGRGIYNNIKKTVIFLLSSNIAEVLTMFVIICLGFPTPLIAIHLLWVNLVTDSLPAVALGMDPKDPNNMKEKPRDPNEGIFAHGGMRKTLIYGLFLTLAVLLAYFSHAWLNGYFSYSDINSFYSIEEELLCAQTMAFTTLALGELFHMVGISNTKKSFVMVFKNKNWMMLIAFVAGVLLQLLVIEVPGIQTVFSTHNLNYIEWLIMAGLSLIPLVLHEIAALIYYIVGRRKAKKNR